MRVGPANPLIVTAFRCLPRLYDRLVGPLFRLAGLTKTPVRHTQGTVFTPRPDLEEMQGRWPAGR
ncbi:hypothetical protein JOF53_000684 [Crossiella equi]|uniref:Uncharacterized protein n=1 Tax=Crossiella equi TaxID=130796 RepID=A0ABS5A6F5_9PSEU|nr:hypothetical protein [Crossiella equi]